jgi:hypothetical protein|tara:strand:- start:2828 stop:3022 length:195 start_codon:yes stop_codon:yes gene_type:complete
MSVDLIEDIDLLKESLILIREGASDEKEIGFDLIQNLITKKESSLMEFEDAYDEANNLRYGYWK